MKKKISINPNTLNAATFAIIGLLMMTVNILLTNYVIKKIRNDTDQQFFKSYELAADGFSTSVHHVLNNYTALLKAYNPEILSTKSPQEIQKYLISTAHKTPEVFSNVFFVDISGIVYSIRGEPFPIQEQDTLYELVHGKEDKFITNPYRSIITNVDSIGFYNRIYTPDNQLKGAICASMSLETFHRIISDIRIGEENSFFITNTENQFIYHSDSSFLSKTVNTLNNKLISSDSQNPALLTKGLATAIDSNNNPVYIFINKIDKTPWYLGLIISKSKHDQITLNQHKYHILVIILSCLLVVFVIWLEYTLSNYFRKKEFITTIYDSLTHLYARPYFESEATKLLRRNKNSKFMIIETDIHGFKFINQNYGVAKADKLIIYYSKLISQLVENSKGIIGRGYADHFYTIIKISSVHKAMTEFKKVVETLNESIKNYEIQFFPKFGITFYLPSTKHASPDGEASIQSLIGQASFAKSIIKDNILTCYAIYDQELLKKSKEEHYIESHMEQALSSGEFFVMYQPKINPRNNKVEGAEALVRWNSSKLGLMPPGKFIPLFERNDFVKELDFFVYEQVFKFLRSCIDNNLPVVPVSLNMARNHSKASVFMSRFLSIFEKYNLPTNLIEIEILERSIMSKTALREITEKLHKAGFKVSMDDFGSGESSLNMLTNIPVDLLKFDKSFLDNACPEDQEEPDVQAANLIEGLIMLSKQLGKKTLFEGVETERQLQLLREMDCDLVQGFYYSKPITETEFIKYVKEHS